MQINGDQVLVALVGLGSLSCNSHLWRDFSKIGASHAFSSPLHVGMIGICTLLGWHSLSIKICQVRNSTR